MTRNHVAIFISFSGRGGVEHMITNLAQGMIDAGMRVDLVLARARGEHLKAIPAGVRVIKLGSEHTFTSLFSLARYLKRERPDALLAAKDRAIKVALLARRLSGVPLTLCGRLGTTVSAALEGESALKKWFWYTTMRMTYRGIDRVIAVSRGVADDVQRITGLPDEKVVVIRNPVITPALRAKAAADPGHPWFEEDIPVILGVGRLTRQKDFPTLLRAFARVHRQRRCRLLLLGDGRDRQQLQRLAEELQVDEDLLMPGFADNPYAYMRRAALFVLSSRWEGSPNVLTEAMAVGTPVVATDCPSGPREILDRGRYGPLVEMGDVEGMAAAILQTLAHPLPRHELQAAVSEYSAEKSAAAYLKALGFEL